MNIVKATLTVGSFTAISRVLGFVRDLLIAAVLGAGAAADAFFVSFKLANLLRRLFAEGAFNAAFVPLFARALEGEGEEEARRFAEEALAVMTAVLLVVVLVAEIAMPWLVRGLAPGFEPAGERYGLAVDVPVLIAVGALSASGVDDWADAMAASLPRATVVDVPTMSEDLAFSPPPCLRELRARFLREPDAQLAADACRKDPPTIDFVTPDWSPAPPRSVVLARTGNG